jgi:hypothetical protein
MENGENVLFDAVAAIARLAADAADHVLLG